MSDFKYFQTLIKLIDDQMFNLKIFWPKSKFSSSNHRQMAALIYLKNSNLNKFTNILSELKIPNTVDLYLFRKTPD